MGDKFMKGLLFTIAVFCIMFLSCSFSSQSSKAQDYYNDTMVCVKRISHDDVWQEKEYFVVINRDTSSYSCILMNSKYGIRISWESMLTHKRFFDYTCNEEIDTTAFDDKWKESEKEFKVPTYKDMLREIDLCMEAASKDYDLRALRSFNCFLCQLRDIAVLTTNNLEANFNLEENGIYSHSDITKALKMTTFEEDLNRIFKKYGKKVDFIGCHEMRLFIPKENFSTSNISKDLKIPDRIMDVQVYVKIKNID